MKYLSRSPSDVVKSAQQPPASCVFIVLISINTNHSHLKSVVGLIGGNNE